jgi:tetratricopeptide (TPR) repeat protein
VWWAQKRAGAQGEARAELQEAIRLQAQEKWTEALGAIRRAKGALTGFWADPALREQVEQRGKDLQMALLLQEARLQMGAIKDEYLDFAPANQAYADAFAWYGLAVDELDPQQAAERIRARSIRAHLVAALDSWAFHRSYQGGTAWRHLLAVSQEVDPAPWRERLRDFLERRTLQGRKELVACALRDEVVLSTAVILARLTPGTSEAEKTVVVLRRLRQQHPDDFWANYQLALSLVKLQPPRLEEAIRYYTVAVALRPDSPGVRLGLAHAFRDKGLHDEAIAELWETIHLKPDYAAAHSSLGYTLLEQGKVAEAEAAYRRAIALKPDLAIAQHLGLAFAKQGKQAEAEAACRLLIALKPDDVHAHGYLGRALERQGKQAEAEAAYRRAVAVKPDYSLAHFNLGRFLAMQGKSAEAVEAYRKAIALKPDIPLAYLELGRLLQGQGRVTEALSVLQRLHELGSRLPGWSNPSAKSVREARRLVDLDARLPQFLSGAAQPAGAGESIELAKLCQAKKQYAAAARFYAAAFAAQPQLAGLNRYNAACVAALAGCGQGKDAADLTPMQRLHWRRQALTWLHADLRAWQQPLTGSRARSRVGVARMMQYWLADADFNGVRGAEALGRLPAEEGAAWARLWADVTDLLAQSKGPMPRDKEKPDKP